MNQSDNVTRIARSFVEAQGMGIARPDYPGTMPGALGDADAAIALTVGKVAGLKVGRINPPIEDWRDVGLDSCRSSCGSAAIGSKRHSIAG